MKDLKDLTNVELISYYDEMRIYEQYELSKNLSGGHHSSTIVKTFESMWEEFIKEFEKRNIELCDNEVIYFPH
jgi:hypothetical protein